MGWWAKFWESKPEDWRHLGWTEIKYTAANGDGDQACVIQFYADVESGTDWPKRKVTLSKPDEKYGTQWKEHPFYQKAVVPWLHGENVYRNIKEPSDWLCDYAMEKHGFQWMGGKWVKPAPKVERDANVIVPAKWGQRGDS